jgi:predicted amidohydrolase YtcJ
MMIHTLIGCLALLTAASAAAETGKVKTFLYRNANVLTFDAAFSTAQTLAARGDRILAVGPEAEVAALAGSDVEIVDLKGRTVISGPIDNHVHAIRAAATWAEGGRLDGASTREEALDRIRRKAAVAPKGQWIYSQGGFTDAQFGDGRVFNRAELDEAAPHHPVYLQHMYSHAYINLAAAKASGLMRPARYILSETGEIPAGEDGLPLGAVAGRAMDLAMRKLPSKTPEKSLAGAEAVMRDHAAAGLTSIFDMGGFGIRDEDYTPFAKLAATGKLPIRVFHTRWFRYDNGTRGKEAFERELREMKPLSGPGHFRLIGAGELIYMPVFDSIGQPGSPLPVHLDEFGKILRALAKAGWPMRIHAESDTTISQHLDLIEKIAADTPVAHLGWTIEHRDTISEASLKRMKNLGMMVALHSRPVVFGRRRLRAPGEEALSMPPIALVRASGVPWGLGSDSVMANVYNPFVTLWWAVSGKSLDGALVTRPPLSREDALIAHSRSNAYLLFSENELGTLEKSKLADFVVLSDDYMSVPEDRIRHFQAVMTVVGGKIVHDSRPSR